VDTVDSVEEVFELSKVLLLEVVEVVEIAVVAVLLGGVPNVITSRMPAPWTAAKISPFAESYTI
jgi:hypothetical protein